MVVFVAIADALQIDLENVLKQAEKS